MTKQPRSKNKNDVGRPRERRSDGGKTLVLSRAPEGVSKAPEINEGLKKQGRYFGDSSTRITRSDRDT